MLINMLGQTCHVSIFYYSEERRKYYKHITKAKSCSDRYLSIIIDSMDQNKTYLPHFLYNGTFLSNMWKLRLNLVGVIMHGIGKFINLVEFFVKKNYTLQIIRNITTNTIIYLGWQCWEFTLTKYININKHTQCEHEINSCIWFHLVFTVLIKMTS